MIEASVVARMPLFATLPPDELGQLATMLRQLEYASDTVLFHEGEPGDRLYVVIEGEIEVIKALGTPEQRMLGVRRSGEFVGEMSLLGDHEPRTASVLVRAGTQLLELTQADFDGLLQRHPTLAYQMLRVVSQRLRESHTATIHDLQQKNHQLATAYTQLQAAQAQIIEQETLRRELEVAREIQQSLLPHTLPQLAGIDIGARMQAARMVGGDFYDVIPLSPDQVGLVVGDVCGKGVPSALLMALICSFLRAEATRSDTPELVLRALNQHLLSRSAEGMFVTVLYGILDRQRMLFQFARAGHELPLLWDQHNTPIPITRGLGHPLGLFEQSALDVQTIALQPGSSLLLFTDGVTEALNPAQEFFGLERLAQVVHTSTPEQAQSLCDRLLALILTHQHGSEQSDDITLLAARIN